MKTNKIMLALTALFVLFFTTFTGTAQSTKPNESIAGVVKIEIIQFHSEHRCMSCNKIELLTREVLKDYAGIPFSLVNVDVAKNEKKAKQFEATGTALFLYNPKTGKKKDLTEFAFMQVGNKDKFIEGLKKEIALFQQQ